MTKNLGAVARERTAGEEATKQQYLPLIISGQLTPKGAEAKTGIKRQKWAVWAHREKKKYPNGVQAKAHAVVEVVANEISNGKPALNTAEAITEDNGTSVSDCSKAVSDNAHELKTLRSHVIEQTELMAELREGLRSEIQGVFLGGHNAISELLDKIREALASGKVTRLFHHKGEVVEHVIPMTSQDYIQLSNALKGLLHTAAKLHGVPFDEVRLESLKGAAPQLHQHLHLHKHGSLEHAPGTMENPGLPVIETDAGENSMEDWQRELLSS